MAQVLDSADDESRSAREQQFSAGDQRSFAIFRSGRAAKPEADTK
jgi:hypothetical protein